MIFRPSIPASLWDSWMYIADDVYHLFYLRVSDTTKTNEWDSIGHAVSTDLIDWKEVEPIHIRTENGWDSGVTLTGSVVRHDDMYLMFYGSYLGNQNRIGLLVSEDLYHWHKHADNPVLCAMPPYQAEPIENSITLIDWRDAQALWRADLGCYDVYLCARQAVPDAGTAGACIAHLRTKDFLHYEALPPIVVPENFFNAEVPDYFMIGKKHYILFSSFVDGEGVCRHDTPSRIRPIGTWYAWSDNREGPYTLPPDPLLIGAGHVRLDPYVGRTIPYENGRLLYHHMGPPRPSWGAPKWVKTESDGQLYLEYWDGLQNLRNGMIRESFFPMPSQMSFQSTGKWALEGETLHGKADCIKSSILFDDVICSDYEIECSMEVDATTDIVALLYDMDGQPIEGQSIAIYPKEGRVEAGLAKWTIVHCLGLGMFDSCTMEYLKSRKYHIRLIVRAEFMECFINDRWCFSSILPKRAAKPQIGFSVCGGSARFSGFHTYAIKPFKD